MQLRNCNYSIMSDNTNDDLQSKISVILVGVGLAALIVTIYHCIMNRRRAINALQRPRPRNVETPQSSVEISTAQLIPAYKYQKGLGLGSVGDDGGTCAICLGEFEEGEELRTLPECLHSYHAPCIDMWLHSHSSCPMCRTDAMSTPQGLSHTTDFNPRES